MWAAIETTHNDADLPTAGRQASLHRRDVALKT
jgi:hypothetical protein